MLNLFNSDNMLIEEIADEVRVEFELRRVDLDLLSLLYREFAVVTDMYNFLKAAQKQFPIANSGLAGVYLQSILGGELVGGYYKQIPHTFLFLDEKLVVDITADQFGGPRVYVGPLTYPYTTRREKIGTV